MLERRTLMVFAMLVAGYALLALPAYVGPAFLEGFSSVIVVFTLLSLHLFHSIGVPGLLEHNGNCGWGWCGPTAFGWFFLALFWLGVVWLAAWAVARLTSRRL